MRERRNRLRESKLSKRRILAQKEKPTKWWSDSSKVLPLLISVVALTISSLGWLESHKGRLISEEVNRPILSLLKIEGAQVQTMAFRSDEKAESLALFHVYLNNIGKSTARVETINIEASMTHPEECKLYPRQDNYVSNEILPGTQGYFSMGYTASNECGLNNLDFFSTTIAISYTDAGTGRQYSQSFGQLVRTLMDLDGQFPEKKNEDENKVKNK